MNKIRAAEAVDVVAGVVAADRLAELRRIDAEARRSEHDEGVAGRRSKPEGADKEIVAAVIVNIGAADCRAAEGTDAEAVDHDAVRILQRAEIERRRKPASFAINQIGAARIRRAVRVGEERADKKIVKAVAVDVTDPRDRNARLIVRRCAVDGEAGCSVERGDVKRR